MAFEPSKHMIKVQGGRQYLPVSARIVWFRTEHPDWGIHTEPVEINHERQYAVFRASIYNAEGRLIASGTKKEDVKGFPDWLEKAETGSVGRALAMCGYGTQFAPDLDETGGRNPRYADSPAAGRGGYNRPTQHPAARPAASFRPDNAQASVADANRNLVTDTDTVAPTGDFEGGDFEGDEEDPFGEDTAPAEISRAHGDPNHPACVKCGKAITKAQREISIRKFDAAYCSQHQKEAA